ncbi:hypothetical protein ACHAWX_000036 [Stephanocyclus meneghinianus]
MQQWLSGAPGHPDKYPIGNNPEEQCAFKILMTHEALQLHYISHFALVIVIVGSKTSLPKL